MTIKRSDMTVNRARAADGRVLRLHNSSVMKVLNTFSGPSGALNAADRGAWQSVPYQSGNPHENPNYIERWRQYCRLYEISWEARKIVRIPVEDALRKAWEVQGIPEEMADGFRKRLDRLGFVHVLERSLMLERLLGGCLTFLGVEGLTDDPGKPLNPVMGERLAFVNSIPVSRINRINWNTDPLSPEYMRPQEYMINGQSVHTSRCLIWDGEPLFDPYDYALTQFTANLAGFGPSVLAAIWDDIKYAVGTRQSAYHLIQVNNALIMAVNELGSLEGTRPGQDKIRKLNEVANSLSTFRAALLDKGKVEISQNAASFGSVPELIIAYLQVLSAASDIPATRFLGQAPGGLNATGESDLENYYNMIDAIQTQRIEPQLLKLYDILGYEMYPHLWKKERENLDIKFPPLWNMDELQEAQKKSTLIDNLLKMHEAGMISDEKFIKEINAEEIFSVKLDSTDISIVDDFGGMPEGGEDGSPPPDGSVDSTFNKGEKTAKPANPQGSVGSAPNPQGPQSPEPTKGPTPDKPDEDKEYAQLENQFIPVHDYPEPTEAQKSAGNYKKFHTVRHGFDISIENPAGSMRSGIGPDGESWSSILPAHYGYIRRTEGADGDHVDVFLGPHDDSDQIFVIDQKNPDTGEFDEHKCIFGALSMMQAKQMYLDSFSDGRGGDRLMALTPATVEEFRQWVKIGDTRKPFQNKGEFKESDHPRAEDGKFGSGPGSSKTEDKPAVKRTKPPKTEEDKPVKKSSEEKKVEADKRWEESMAQHTPEDRAAHEKARERGLKVPPAWKDVWVSPDPSAALQVRGTDAAGRTQRLYSVSARNEADAQKFVRLKNFAKAHPKIMAKVRKDFSKSEEAKVLHLIAQTGFRIGGEPDPGAKAVAYGASTLLAEHVKIEGDKLHFSFTGKKGVQQEHTIEDAKLAATLKSRTKGPLFDTTPEKVRAYLKKTTPDAKKYKVKDFRTYVATATAAALVSQMPPPKTQSEKAKKIMEVAKVVSQKLGNTPTMAKNSYIDPAVFRVWEEKRA